LIPAAKNRVFLEPAAFAVAEPDAPEALDYDRLAIRLS
jgi:hypothetical protein